MVFPELDNDESVILQAHNIKVKSVVFEAVLTNKRLILVDDKKGFIPAQEILISSINTVDGGENAIRDPILTFSIFASGGSARQMILTFPRTASGERRRERDDWLRALIAQITAKVNAPAVPETPSFEQSPPITPPPYQGSFGASSQKKKLEITRPKRNIIEAAPAMPRPIETTSLPIGSFCSRCGNRVPPESVFCNKCGTAVVSAAEGPAAPTTAQPTIVSTTPAAAPSVVPQVQIPTPPVFGLGGDRKDRSLEEVIHSIEPLIEDSKPRSSEPAPLVPRQYPAPPAPVEIPVVIPPADATNTEVPAESLSGEPVPADASSATSPPLSDPFIAPKKSRLIPIAALAIVILVIIGGIVVFSNLLGGITPQAPVITPTPTPVPTVAIATPTPIPSVSPTAIPEITPPPTPEFVIPPNGVWMRITYPGKYGGTYGTPGSQYPVGERNTGDQLFMVSTINGPVEASIQKLDGSSDTLAVEVYKNGELMKRATSVSPRAIIEFQVDLKPKPTPTPLPTQTIKPTSIPGETAILNSTVNATGTV
ncbi:MAG: zinc-ribbon domain-containing protein [Methanoregula sp.]|nr:zinc-ribbon domain-containing protein [Methanoregula sp.]